MSNKISAFYVVVFLSLVVCALMEPVQAYTITNDTITYENAYGKIEHTPYLCMDEFCTVYSNYTNNLNSSVCYNIALGFNQSDKVSITKTEYYNAGSWNELTLDSKVAYGGKWYYKKGINFDAGETKQIRQELKLPFNTSGKFDTLVWKCGDTIAEAKASGQYILLDPWWDLTYLYRRTINITENSGKSLTNYQINFTINTTALIINGTMNDNCSDMRFRNSTNLDNISLDYWVQYGCNTSATTIWVEVPTITASTNTLIYMYYGNINAVNASNGTNTFPNFEDFESYTNGQDLNGVNNWSVTHLSFDASNNHPVSGSLSGWWNGSAITAVKGAFWDLGSQSTNFTFHYTYYRTAQHYRSLWGTGLTVNPSLGCSVLMDNLGGSTDDDLSYYDGGFTKIINHPNFPHATFFDFQEKHIVSADTYTLKIDEGSTYYGAGIPYDDSGNPRYFISTHSGGLNKPIDIYFDNLFTRAYAIVEPSINVEGEVLSEGVCYLNITTPTDSETLTSIYITVNTTATGNMTFLTYNYTLNNCGNNTSLLMPINLDYSNCLQVGNNTLNVWGLCALDRSGMDVVNFTVTACNVSLLGMDTIINDIWEEINMLQYVFLLLGLLFVALWRVEPWLGIVSGLVWIIVPITALAEWDSMIVVSMVVVGMILMVRSGAMYRDTKKR